MSRVWRALRDFLRGFTGLAPLGRDSATVRDALEHRSSHRDRCC